MKSITRRELLQGSFALAAGLVLGGQGVAEAARRSGGGMGGGGMGGGVLDPPVGGLFQDPPVLANLSTTPGIVEVDLTAVRAPGVINGVVANLLTYNGQFPAGTIRAHRGDLLRVNFRNHLPANGAVNLLGHPLYVTNLHTHGLHVSPGDNPNGTHCDNMLVMLQPGEETSYEYDLSKQHPGSLNFYHPHIHGSVTDQMWGGMAGCLVVEEEVDSLAAYETHIMMLKDITVSGSEPVPHSSMMAYMQGVEGDTVMVNGQVNPRLDIQPGAVQRWRIVNTCTARFFRLSLLDHTMYLVGTEGGLLDKPYAVTELLLSPGERVDILIKASNSSGSYRFLSLPYSRMGNMGGQQVTLATITYSGSRRREALPEVVDPEAKRLATDTSNLPRKRMSLSMGQGRGYINGMTYMDHEHCYEAHSTVGTREVWEVTNASNMDHPFHHHTNSAQVLAITGGDLKYASLYTTIPAWKDVTIVPKWGKIELLMPVMDYGGMAMFHCHIIEHEDIGMMGMWHLNDGSMPMT